MRILVFLHGTTIMHPSGIGCSREERVGQSRAQERSIYDYAAYVPIGNAVEKLQRWRAQRAEIIYLSSHRKPADIAQDAFVLKRFGFPPGLVLFRGSGESYTNVAEQGATRGAHRG